MKTTERISQIDARVAEIARGAEGATRNFTAEEMAELNGLARERTLLSLQLRGGREANAAINEGNSYLVERQSVAEVIRSAVRDNRQMQLVVRAEGDGGGTQTPTTTPTDNTIKKAVATAGGIVPLSVGEIVKPLQEGLIYNKIGVKLPTGLSGEYVWPVVGSSLEVEYVGEGVALTDKPFEMSKISATPQRMGITVVLTRESIFNSNGMLEDLVREQMIQAFPKGLNAVLLGGSTKGNFTSPFATAKCVTKTVDFNFKGLNSQKAAKLALGYSSEGLVWVMSEATKADLEATPKDTGSGIMTVENDRLCGLPVFCSSAVGEKIGLGDFRYLVCGQFGTPSFIVDPMTLATEDKVRITINMYFSMTTLREDAFSLLTRKTS